MNQFFGEMALLTDQPRTATVRAAMYCDMSVLHRRSVLALLKEYPVIARRIKKVLRHHVTSQWR